MGCIIEDCFARQILNKNWHTTKSMSIASDGLRISLMTFIPSLLLLPPQLFSMCTFPCNCTSTVFEPVCGADEVNYFSPCRAGCNKRLQDGDPNVSYRVFQQGVVTYVPPVETFTNGIKNLDRLKSSFII